MDELVEQRRILPGDALAVLFDDLCQAGAVLAALDGRGVHGWVLACVDLLSAVPDLGQRMSWAYALARAIHRAPWSVDVIAGELLCRAGEMRGAGMRKL